MNRIYYYGIMAVLSGTALPLFAQNPIVPPGVYIADPSAHVWKDGKIYVYGSRDESAGYYCSHRYDVLSSSDAKSWMLHPSAFASKGENDEVSYNDGMLYAPDCQYRDGNYYLYFCSDDWTEGVAVSRSPAGPFTRSKKVELFGKSSIDPCVFIDDDGQAYYLWGQFSAKMAKLKPNMAEIDSATIHEGLVTEKEHFFHEGAYLTKHNGLYYLVYADISRGNRPTCLGYATAQHPFGPYTYRGVIIDNDHCDPASWNNHGSLAEFNGQWYVFYHRSTHGSETMRKACAEPVRFNPDGSIPEVEMTTQGAGSPVDARQRIDAERACLLFGNVRVTACAADNEVLSDIRGGDKAAYKYIDFGAGADSICIQVNPGTVSGSIQLLLDPPWTAPVASIDIPARSSDTKEPVVIRKKIPRIKGVHALWLQFSGQGEELYQPDWFQFL